MSWRRRTKSTPSSGCGASSASDHSHRIRTSSCATHSTNSWSVGLNALSWSESMSISAIAAPSRRIGTTISARVLMKHCRYRGSSFTSGTMTVALSFTAAPQMPSPIGIRRCRVAVKDKATVIVPDVNDDPGVMRNLPQLAAHEVRDRLALASGVDDLLEASGDLVVTDLALLAGHDLAELPDSLHRRAPLRRTVEASISLVEFS